MTMINLRWKRLYKVAASAILVLMSVTCNAPKSESPSSDAEPDIQEEIIPVQDRSEEELLDQSEPSPFVDPEALSALASDEVFPLEHKDHLIYPENIIYQGAFRLPSETSGSNWEYSGYAMTYYPKGDPQGNDDGYPGSLFVLGHDHHQQISEIDIPSPVISVSKYPNDLPAATTLQPFQDITKGMFGELEIPRAGLAYLPRQGEQTSGKLYFCWGQHFQFEQVPSHGWSELDLSRPESTGPWYVGSYPNYVTNDYLFELPIQWSDEHTPGLRLVTGRFRDGTWGGLGPTLFALGPWNEGNPPQPEARLEELVPLLLYGELVPGSPEIDLQEERRMDTYKPADEWSGGAWLTISDKSGVILVGTKATGENWYGFANGVRYPTSGDPNEPIPEVPPWPYDDRGWWSEGASAQILFFDPADLADVARGEFATWEPQPYASMVIDSVLFDPGMDLERYKRYVLGAVTFDRERGFIYIVERNADEERSLIHVYQLER